ncbi:hypothetical protein [Parasphingorhabdus sp.]|uniref:hypothetical protein n=1 Tax=Parasphingorhabdus sp. TaxID=2709688 RepID=UPI002F927F1E
MPTKNALLNVDQRIHAHCCKCRGCHPRMPGEYSFWVPCPSIALIGFTIAATAIAINYFSFA